jgi:CIC family chloride channel protein
MDGGERPGLIRGVLSEAREELARAWRIMIARGPSQLQVWFLALLVGIASGCTALFFRMSIGALQRLFYGADETSLATHAATLPWWWIVLLPVLGGLAVGLILDRFTPDARVRAVAETIEGAALRNGRVEKRAGLASGLASLITLSTGGSSGREGPVVHLAAVISAWVSARIRADGVTGRDLLGCAVAAAVSASFNAPIAGAIFALEVVLRHFAVHAFAPIAIASVAGTVINRLEYGGVSEFALRGGGELAFYHELPAFLILGLVCGLVAVALMKAIFWADDFGSYIQRRTGMPRWLRPTLAGLLVGAIAIPFPHVIGVGYETTSGALKGTMLFREAVVLAVMKTIAVAITLGGRMGGGVFSPSLVLGALTGLAFGVLATGVLPDVSGSVALYALAGMGAVSAAVLGAPISTTLIVFELTGDWKTGLAVMTAVSLSTALASRLVDRSFFLTQLARRGVHLAAGPQRWLLSTLSVTQTMRPVGEGEEETLWSLHERGLWLTPTATLDFAMPVFERTGGTLLPVIEPGETPKLIGVLHEVDALRAYTKALSATAAEEHS